MRVSFALSLTILLAGALAACAEKPRPPLMSPIAQVTDFGYADRDLSNGRVKVTYLGPSYRVSTSRESRQALVDQAKAQSEELALWRASQVALDKGKPAFEVVEKHTDLEVDIRHYYEPYPYTWYPYPYYGWRRPYYPLFPPYYGSYRDAYAQAQTDMTIQLLDKMKPGAIDARETADRLSRKYVPTPAQPTTPKTGTEQPSK
jgi:hypothetical protein